MKLVQVQVFFRHGARTPLHHIPTTVVPEASWTEDLVKDHEDVFVDIATRNFKTKEIIPNFFNESLVNKRRLIGGAISGAITYLGQKQLLDLGSVLRDLYSNKVFSVKNPNTIFIRSTDFSRTVRSAQCLLTTLFNRDRTVTNSCSIYVQNMNEDILALSLSSNKYFPVLHNAGRKACLEDKRMTQMKSMIKSILKIDKITDSTRISNSFIDDQLYVVRDDFVSREFHGFPVPESLSKISKEFEELSTCEMNMEYSGPKEFWSQNTAYSAGPIFHEILYNIQNYKKLVRFKLFSAHDSTLMPLLLSLESKFGVWPPYASWISIEVYSTDENEEDPNLDCIPSDNNLIDSQFVQVKDKWDETMVKSLWIKIKFLGEELSLNHILGQPHDSDEKLYTAKSLIQHWEKNSKTRQEYQDMKPYGIPLN